MKTREVGNENFLKQEVIQLKVGSVSIVPH